MDRIYSESVLRELLDNDNPVILYRGEYNNSNERLSGHSVIIYDYHWDSSHSIYLYDIFDPAPVNVGSSYARSYQSICNGRNQGYPTETTDNGVWESIVVYEKGNYTNTIPWPEP